MTGINTNYTPTSVPVSGSSSPAGVQTTADVNAVATASAHDPENVTQGSLSSPWGAGEFAYESASMDGVDWNAITNDLAALPNMSVSLASIMVLSIQIASQMRQDQREQALQDSQNALNSGLAAADEQYKAAMTRMLTSVGTNVLNGAMSAASTLQSASSLNKANSAQANYKGAVDGIEKKYAGKTDTESLKAKANELDVARDTLNTDMTRTKLADQKFQSGLDMVKSVAGIAGSIGEFSAVQHDAEAQRLRAESEYQQSIQQSDQSFFQQLGDSIRTQMDAVKSVEASTHESYRTIYS